MKIKTKLWQKLEKGDKVEIIAPGYGGEFSDVEKAAKFIESLGLVPSFSKDIFGKDLFCSNTDSFRLKNLTEALFNSDSKAVWCFKGGYGTTRIIPEFIKNFEKFSKPKLLIGFSDITALHLLLNQKFKWATLHAPVLWQIVHNKISPESIEKLKQVIFGEIEKIELRNLEPMNIAANREEIVNSTVTGGNLALIQASIGTAYELQAKNKIVLLEEVDERAYRVDRMLEHLKQTGILNKAKAIILGDFIEAETQDKIDIAIRRWAESINVPVLLSKSVGHAAANDPIPFGTNSSLEFGRENFLTISTK